MNFCKDHNVHGHRTYWGSTQPNNNCMMAKPHDYSFVVIQEVILSDMGFSFIIIKRTLGK